MQRAMTAGATSVEASGSLSDAALKLADPTANAEGKELAGAALAVSNAVMALSVSTERTAYLDTGLFYLCQLHANGAMTSPEFASAVEKLIEKSATMPTAATSLGQLFAPQLQRGQRGEGNEESSTPAKDGAHGTPKAEGPKP
ncbi:hypothetical protein CSC75_13990 [Pseudoxanthomonas wuyuanensis]|nr:hypothetical protein CSC75_13990 [Pseudoxanthomonas wuyuanensis]